MKTNSISIVIPAYNEEQNVDEVYAQIIKVLTKKVIDDFEIIFVNDGSTDRTLEKLHHLAKSDKRVKIINFTRNFGKEIATSAGIHAAKCNAVIMVDADGQFPVELIPQFIKKWKDGANIVTGIRRLNQKEGFIKKFGSRMFYALINKMTESKITPQATDFRLFDKNVKKEFMKFGEKSRITRGLIDWTGFKEEFIEFEANERLSGAASYNITKLFKLAMNSFISLSLTPLYFSGYAGLLITFLSLLVGVFIIIEQIILNDPMNLNITGTAMLGVLMLFFLGVILISQGLLALYISHIHIETKNRPLYIIDKQNSTGIED